MWYMTGKIWKIFSYFLLQPRKSRAGKCKITYIFWILLHFLLNFCTQDKKAMVYNEICFHTYFLLKFVSSILWMFLKYFHICNDSSDEKYLKNINLIIWGVFFFALFFHFYLNVSVEFRMHFGNNPNKNIFCNFFCALVWTLQSHSHGRILEWYIHIDIVSFILNLYRVRIAFNIPT